MSWAHARLPSWGCKLEPGLCFHSGRNPHTLCSEIAGKIISVLVVLQCPSDSSNSPIVLSLPFPLKFSHYWQRKNARASQLKWPWNVPPDTQEQVQKEWAYSYTGRAGGSTHTWVRLTQVPITWVNWAVKTYPQCVDVIIILLRQMEPLRSKLTELCLLIVCWKSMRLVVLVVNV